MDVSLISSLPWQIILIFGGIFLHRLSRILKVKLNWIKVPTTEFSKQKCINRR